MPQPDVADRRTNRGLTNDEPQNIEVGAGYFVIRRPPFGNLRFVLALGAARPRAEQVAPFSECGNSFAAFRLAPFGGQPNPEYGKE